jgi:hypothetical protein
MILYIKSDFIFLCKKVRWDPTSPFTKEKQHPENGHQQRLGEKYKRNDY